MVQYWEPGTQYNFGDVVQFEGHRYKIIQPHRSQSDWAPSATPSLWGRLSDEDNDYQQQQPQQQYQAPSGAPQYGGKAVAVRYQQITIVDNGPDQGSSYSEKPSESEHERQEKKHWWDEDPNKKKLEIGGGLLAGAAAIGAGILAYKKHEEKKEEHNSQNWARSNWIADAQARTNKFNQYGPDGPATWILAHGQNIPKGAVIISNEPYAMHACRAYVDGGIQLGKASAQFQKGGVIGYKNEEIHFDEYEILLGDTRGLRWVSVSGRIDISNLGVRPVEGGRENDGTPLYIIRAYYKDAVHPGKTSSKLNGAYIPWGGKEKEVHEYEVLCYA
ncbi:hypothetical protein AX15_004668 [Amanita polypyramis BW_CC]|nr:hypothetical protein AX15_004668 [Amanita polypyramis BW_CC]